MKLPTRFVLCLMIAAGMAACNSVYTPKPKGYFKIDFPAHEYTLFDKPGYPYTFEYPVYAKVTRDSTFFGEETENPYWINIDFPQFNGTIHVSYKEVGKTNMDKLLGDVFKMTYKHTSKASEIRDSIMQTPMGINGIFFHVAGNTATAQQFFLTDSVKHFLRGALYFDATPNEDSLGVVNDFLKTDLRHLINTLQWKDK
jgi:hypothetical protein